MPNSIQQSAPSLAIRLVESDDLADCIELARAFHAESVYRTMPLAIAKVVSTFERAIASDDMLGCWLSAGDSL